MGEADYCFCENCSADLDEKGAPSKQLWELICQKYWLTDMAVLVSCEGYLLTILKYLEQQRFVTTTEVPKSENPSKDDYFVIPKHYRSHSRGMIFCRLLDEHN